MPFLNFPLQLACYLGSLASEMNNQTYIFSIPEKNLFNFFFVYIKLYTEIEVILSIIFDMISKPRLVVERRERIYFCYFISR